MMSNLGDLTLHGMCADKDTLHEVLAEVFKYLNQFNKESLHVFLDLRLLMSGEAI